MQHFTAPVLSNQVIVPGTHLLEVRASALAQLARPGQYCMLRACDKLARDPLLRRPFFVQGVDPLHGLCRFLISVRGRASAWLAQQQIGMELDILGPSGHGWMIRPETQNLLLLGEPPFLSALLSLLSPSALPELSITLINFNPEGVGSYPAVLLPPEIEYQIFTGSTEALALSLKAYLAWADEVCCSVSRGTLWSLVGEDSRWQDQQFAQAALSEPLFCVSETCLACQVETRRGFRRVCREGPVFPLSELVGSEVTGSSL